jgi:hypothetical protein
MDIVGPLMRIGGGALSGALYSGAGYAKSRTKKEPFDRIRFVVALLWGLLVGAIGAWRGWDYFSTADVLVTVMTVWAPSLGLNLSLDWLAKIIVRHVDERLPDEYESAAWDLVTRLFGSTPAPAFPAPPPPSGDA